MEYEKEKTNDLEMRWSSPVCHGSHVAHGTSLLSCIWSTCLAPVGFSLCAISQATEGTYLIVVGLLRHLEKSCVFCFLEGVGIDRVSSCVAGEVRSFLTN